MLDLRFIRENPEFVKAALVKLNTTARIDEILAGDIERRELLSKVENLRAERNAVSKEIGRMQDAATRDQRIAAMRQVGEQIEGIEKRLAEVEINLQQRLLEVPNMPHPAVPVGQNDSENRIVRTVGEIPKFDFPIRPHWEIGEQLGIIDFERGTKLSGSRFYVLYGLGARLERALINWMLEVHIQQGYQEVWVPFMVKAESMVGTGNLPKFGENLYHDAEEDYWFIPTAEVPMTNLYRDEILEPGKLPIYHVAYTPCFRREKMSAGKDVRGIKRGHQFDKVEMVKFVEPQYGDQELSSLLDDAEEIARQLKLPYRIVEMCTGDLSFVAARKFDIEVWGAGSGEWLEVSSCSLFTDFQARRANIRYRPEPGARPEYVYTLNGSGLALPRVVISILENYQQPDGTVRIPDVLQPFMGVDKIGG
ncbi:MAG: serine--tRNA ligase [Chloroflexi bacterium]|nr:serine--tRNA ligase [Chloroflexota bacterium]